MSRLHLLLLAVVFEGGLAGLAFLLGWWWDFSPMRDWRFDWLSVGQGVALTVPIFVVFVVFARWPIGPLRPIKKFMDEVVRPLFANCTVIDLAIVSLLAGIGEEFLFRAVFQPAIGEWLGPWWGIGIASVLFGLLHPITATYAVLAMFAGVYLGWVYHETGNIVPGVIAHALYDLLALYVVVKCGPQIEEEMASELEYNDE